MNRSFTTREKILMAVLAIIVIGCFYYLAVYKPSMEAVESSDTRLDDAQTQLLTEQAKSQRLKTMQDAIDAATASGEINKVLPNYDNTKAEMSELNSILSTANTYTVTFEDPVIDGNVVRRPVSITYTASSYDDAEAVLRSLINGKYSCLVTDVSIKSSSNTTSSSTKWTAGVEAVMFERVTAEAQSTLKSTSNSSTSNSSSSVTSDVSNSLIKNSNSSSN